MIRQRTIKTDFFAIASSSSDNNHQDKAPDYTQMTVHVSLLQRIRRPSIIFVYVCTWILFYLLVHYTEIGASMGRVQQEHEGNSIPVAQVVVSSIFFVICVEIIKILVSAGLYLIEDPQHTLVDFCAIPFLKSLLIQYIPTAVLYAIYNNLMFFNLRANLPTAYLIISASRLGMTAFAWQIYFKDGDMSPMRKLAIVLITLGIFTRGIAEEKVIDVNHTGTDAGHIIEISSYHHNIGNAILILLQILCSVLAGIYNEKLLKNDTCSQHLQNICLYLNSIAVNVIIGTVIIFLNMSKGESVVMDLEMEKLVSPTSILIILTLSMAGIMSSMVLRYENSITKCVASASETVFTSLIEYFWFGHVYRIPEMLSILLVSSGTVLYSIPPSNHKIKITRALKVSRRSLICLCIFFYVTTLFLCHISYQSYVVKESQDNKRHLVNFLRNQPKICTKASSFRPRPIDVRETKYRHVSKAEEVMKYIITKLDIIGAPVSLMYGTLLHEYRNGTGTCVQPNLYDKDFDIALFEVHFYAVEALTEEIKKIFDWQIRYIQKKDLFMILAPPRKAGKGFQIDVYGFKCNHPREGLIYFPWDKVTVSMDSFLPIVKHKTIMYDDDVAMNFRTVGDSQRLYYHIPFNVSCLLPNMYGPDFMTPKKGHFIRKTAYDNPKCDRRVLTVAEQKELERQLTFTEKPTNDVIPSTKIKKMDQNRLENNAIAKKNDAGIISCVRSREDVVFALELANRFQELRYNGSANLALELYHFASISPFLTAKLELIRGVQVIEIENTSNELKHCVSDALSMTSLTDITVVEPSLIFLHRSSNLLANKNMENKISLLQESLKDQTQQQSLKLIRSVMSTSASIDDALQFAKLQKMFRFQQVYMYQSISKESTLEKQEIFSRNGLGYVGSLYTGHFLFDFLYPDVEIIRWSSYHYTGQLICQKDGSTPNICPEEVSEQVESTLRRYRHWLTMILLDRPLGWIAFEGGLVKKDPSSLQTDGCASFNSVEAAKKSARFPHSSEHKTILNIDLIMTSDKENFAMHSESSFGPIHYGQNILHPPSKMALTEVQNNLRNPCLSNEFIHEWFDNNHYRSYATCDECSLGISSASAFLNDIVLKEEVSIIFDLKIPDGEKQETQAQQIISLIRDASRSETDVQKLIERVGIRYFAVSKDGSISLEVLPSQLHKKILMPESPTNILKVYINAPSKVACLQLAQWASDQGTQFEGCFVIQGHVSVATSWHNAERELNISKTLRNTKGMKLICDIPREQAHPDTRLWKKGLVSCVEDGYDWIHQPFPVASEADYSVISNSMLASITLDSSLIANKLSIFSVSQLASRLRSKFQDYISHWGVTSPYHWKPYQQQFSFVGDRQSSNVSSQSNGHMFRCVTKILTVMLFLRFEEIGLLSLDDTISSSVTKVTWKQVFSNTAGTDGSHAGKKFEYSNSLWSHVSDFVEKLTGVSFVEAISFYILSPMGLSGYFDEYTPYPPFTARGFRGSNEDLLVIGSTLASGGVSPKTRMRVISMSSVEKMLHDWTSEQNVITSFIEDKTVKNMNRFCSSEKDNSLSSYRIVDGYGMGLWRVKGWRTRGDITYAVRGWLSMGSSEALMYFDEDSIVVGMCSQNRILGLELTAPFASIVKEIGSHISYAFMSHSQWERTETIQ